MVEPLPRARFASYLALTALAWIGIAALMARFTDAAAPWQDAAVAALSVLAQFLLARRHLESWLIWIAVDLLAIQLFWSRDLIPTAALLWVLIQRFSIIPAASARLGCTFRVLGALGALLCVGMLCKLLYVPGGTYGCTVQQYGSLAFYFATCHELPQAIFELVRGSVSEQTLLTSLAMGCIGLCGLAAMLTTVPRSNPTKKDKAD